MVHVELVYVAQDKSTAHFKMSLACGSTVLDALSQSKIYEMHPEAKALSVGIYAKKVALDYLLRDGDRVELYRPLMRDPKEKRRQLAKTRRHVKK